MDSSSSSMASSGRNTRHGQPQELRLAASVQNSTLRQAPPSAYLTPSGQARQRRSQHQQLFQLRQPSESSPFLSPLPSLPTEHSTKMRSPRPQHTPAHTGRISYDSPFTSPPTTAEQHHRTNRRLEPLVLDPSSAGRQQSSMNGAGGVNSRLPGTPSAANSTGSANEISQRLWEVATRQMRHPPPSVQSASTNSYHASPAVASISEESAAVLARQSAKAGFLEKLGRNIPEFKRRFFILKAETNLYYYLSPSDTEPRGKIPLDGSHVQTVEQPTLPDGRYRFQIVWKDNAGSENGDNVGADDRSSLNKVVLQARSDEMGQEWMQIMEQERVSTLKHKVDELNSQNQRQATEIEDLRRQVENFKLVEKDRDGALEDARQWKEQFERLDESLRLLTQRVRKPPNSRQTVEKVATDSRAEDEKKDTDSLAAEAQGNDDTPTKHNKSKKHTIEQAATTLLDGALEKDDDGMDVEEIMKVPGTYFSGLANACEQQRESLRLAAIEASTAVEDVQEANTRVEAIQSRMDKAEKHLTKLWEENCAIRKTLKQKKREKRILVREYKALQQSSKDLEEEMAAAVYQAKSNNRQPLQETSQNVKESDVQEIEDHSGDERLLQELEEHVASSIRLHERLVAASDFLDPGEEADVNTSMESVESHDQMSEYGAGPLVGGPTIRFDNTFSSSEENGGRPSPLQPKVLQPKLKSLFDGDDESEHDDGAEEDEDEGDVGVNAYQTMTPSVVSSVGAEYGSCEESSYNSEYGKLAASTTDSSPDRTNPLLQLDQDETNVDTFGVDQQPNSGTASVQSGSSKSVVTENGYATSRLACPLADVAEMDGDSKEGPGSTGSRVYHLTFYSRKIGVLFQRAPPAPLKPKGLLTAAMTADLEAELDGSEKTAAELRNVAAISSLARGRNSKNEEVCPVSMPEDIVLVCGFEDFDESGMNQKPTLGARLVAFDGISVEIGHWTFDGIRNAIRSRDRPLTLSFRDDYLTTEQRAVLTRAVMDVDAKSPKRPSVPQRIRPPSTTPSVTSHDSELFINDVHQIPEHDLSKLVQEKDCCHENLSAASQSVSTQYGRLRRLSSSSHSTHQSNLRSFSEAGSSITTTWAPMVANLMRGVKEKRSQDSEFTPQYLKRADSLDNSPYHHDFKSNLL